MLKTECIREEMIMLNRGDRVVCIDDSNNTDCITRDKVYTIMVSRMLGNDNTIWIMNDNGLSDFFSLTRFVSLVERRIEIIDEILD